jgi:hypothetical protein
MGGDGRGTRKDGYHIPFVFIFEIIPFVFMGWDKNELPTILNYLLLLIFLS